MTDADYCRLLVTHIELLKMQTDEFLQVNGEDTFHIGVLVDLLTEALDRYPSVSAAPEGADG